MRNFSQQTPDGRTIAADPDLRRHIAQPPPRAPEAAVAERANGSALVAFVAGSIAALPELPAASGSRLCLQLFLIGAADAFWRLQGLPVTSATQVLSRLFERYGLPGNETAGLIEALPQLRCDPSARQILQQGEQAMNDFLGSHDPNLLLLILDLVADWRRQRLCRDAQPSESALAQAG
ncbi:MAG: hypothetical protein LJE69_19465 [Thiohalocapsa sp.]|jgi:hypothetical protein|uniref:hypothetical protein n=1 Tax=Thiohalocapsa sp. TaxID=2497641 RepID=UPI0025EE990F|nr:hypothetical protein [Thiohalocapsa sp.]MCG6943416.1 hypothetical protein [Thiohalocapsa sp.]